jgi:hypothetical protein
MNPLATLLRSRKFWLSLIAVAQTIIFHYFTDFPPEVWQAINVILLFLVGTITAEDAAAKLHGNHPAQLK